MFRVIGQLKVCHSNGTKGYLSFLDGRKKTTQRVKGDLIETANLLGPKRVQPLICKSKILLQYRYMSILKNIWCRIYFEKNVKSEITSKFNT